MKLVITAEGTDWDAALSPFFGRCPRFVFVDIDSDQCETVDNPSAMARGGAGIHAAQFVVERGAEAVVTGNVGPNAYQVLHAADIPVYLSAEGTVRQVVEAYKAGALQPAEQPNLEAHAGMGGARGWGSPAGG